MIHKSRTSWPLLVALALLSAAPAALAQRLALDSTKLKSSESLRQVFNDAITKAAQSTVYIRAQSGGSTRQVAMGTIMTADGFILTKASEVMNQSKIFVILAEGGGTKNYDVKIVGFSEPYDLAMLKIDAKNLTPITLADTRPAVPDAPDPSTQPAARAGGAGRGGRGGRGRGAPPVLPAVTTAPTPPAGAIAVTVGEWVACPDAAASIVGGGNHEPFAVGVVSTPRRRIPGESGFLGVSLGDADPALDATDSGARVMQVIPDSAAEKAGVKVDDVITSVNGLPVHNRQELIDSVRKFRPGDVVTVVVDRAGNTMELRIALGQNNTMIPAEEQAVEALLNSATSQRSSDFPAVFQHDTIVPPAFCGGPLVDLDGRVIGVNIARAGRTESYAIPADIITSLLEPLKNGKLAPVNANKP